MKKNIGKTFVGILLLAILIPCFTSCNKDLDGCGLTVVVVDAISGERISNAKIHISQGTGTITRDGISDSKGEAYFFFDHEAIFNINSSYGTPPTDKNGSATVRLKYDKVVTKEVRLQ